MSSSASAPTCTSTRPTSTLAEGTFNVLLGTTLAGKTTLMQLMAGLERPTSGEVFFRGKNVTGVPVQKRNVSMVYQQFINYPNFTVYENIASPLRVAGMPAGEIEPASRARPNLLRLTPMLERRPTELSGGQQQRTAIARALVKDADLILLDEPLANLDYKLREELRDELPKLFAGRELHRRLCHHRADRGACCSAATPRRCMRAGSRSSARPRRSTASPRDLITAQVFSDPPINTAPVTKQGGEILIGDSIRLPAGRFGAAIPDGVVRSASARITSRRRRAAPTLARSRAACWWPSFRGSESVVHFDLNGRTWVSQSHGIHPFEVGIDRAALCRCRRELLLRRRRPAHCGRRLWLGSRSTISATAMDPWPMATVDWALRRMTLELADGGAYALLGPSGCGKTTLLNLISGLLRPTEGRILFDGLDVTDETPGGAQHRAGVPVPGHLRHDDGLRQSRLPAAQPRRPRGRGRPPRARDRRHARARADARAGAPRA